MRIMLQAWHTFLLEVSPIVLAEPFELNQIGWGASVPTAQPFSSLSREALLGPGPQRST